MEQSTTYQVLDQPDQPYVAVVGHVTMQTIPEIGDRYGEVFGWLAEHGYEPAGPPFFRYRLIDMDRELVIEAGVPVTEPVTGSGEVRADVLPAGRYVTTTHVGHPSELVGVTAGLLGWAEQQGLRWDVQPSSAGEVWGCRLEHHETEPDQLSDLDHWQTRLAFRLADAG